MPLILQHKTPPFPVLYQTIAPAPPPPSNLPMAILSPPFSASCKSLACQCSTQLLHCPVNKTCLLIIVHVLRGCCETMFCLKLSSGYVSNFSRSPCPARVIFLGFSRLTLGSRQRTVHSRNSLTKALAHAKIGDACTCAQRTAYNFGFQEQRERLSPLLFGCVLLFSSS